MINIIGNILGTSGYDVHTKQLANALNKLVNVKLITQVPPGTERVLSDKELEMIKRKEYDINLIITNPIYWRLYTNNKRNWVFLIWEGDKIPKHFLKECLNDDIEYILVPSEHTYNAIRNTLIEYEENKKPPYSQKFADINKKIKVIPHGVNLDLFYPKEKPTDKFRFLCNKGFRNIEDRGGIQYAIQAYLEEFTNKDNVELIVKINPAYQIGDLKKLVNDLMPKNRTDLPIFKIFFDNIPYDKMVNLYNECQVFVSPTRAEAFNLPCLEAMACGLPVITTNFGGQTDYVNNENGWIVDGKLTEVKHEISYEGCSWLTPNIKLLREKMREAYEDKELVKLKSKKALEKSKELTWDNTSKLIQELI